MAGLYNQYWRYASVDELITLLRSTTYSLVVEVALFFGLLVPLEVLPTSFPRSVPILDGLLTMFLVGGVRLSVRIIQAVYSRHHGGVVLKPALIVGAGVAGALIVKELQSNKSLGLAPVGYVDDDPDKGGKWIHGVQVLGPLGSLPKILKDIKPSQVIIAMPTAPGKVIRGVVQSCKEAGIISKTIPGLFEIVRGTARVSQMRSIQLEDLLRRGAVQTDSRKVMGLLRGARVMVTGAGGSIGSELCRQIKDADPSELILLGHGEFSIFQIMQELNQQPGLTLRIHPVIADIRDRDRMDQVLTQYRPQVIFHAAAHKHVSLMEANIAEAVSNNILGTRNLVDLAERHDVSRFVMISSDKAVNPTSIMGVTKRIAELLVQEAALRCRRGFVTVRFGNVLGSRGSVVPIFRRQLEHGGPITITDPEVKRYFMTIPEAVQLVLQAAAMGCGGEVFVLDMGEQIKVIDLARDLLRLSGLVEGRDIDFMFTGLKTGEKMYEELFFKDDRIDRTDHEKILVCRVDGLPADRNEVDEGSLAYEEPLRLEIDTLLEAAQQGALDIVERMLKKLVPQYQSHLKDGELKALPAKEPVQQMGVRSDVHSN
jgi:FlaA1/EpsC-like NDP-sugar epimerase